MKLFSFLVKVGKYLLWLILVVLLGFFLIGGIKHDGGVKDYVSYLNDKNRSDVKENIDFRNPLTWKNLFWENLSLDTSHILSGDNVEEFELTGIDIDGTKIDLLNIDSDDEFDAFFEEESEEESEEDLSKEKVSDRKKEEDSNQENNSEEESTEIGFITHE